MRMYKQLKKHHMLMGVIIVGVAFLLVFLLITPSVATQNIPQHAIEGANREFNIHQQQHNDQMRQSQYWNWQQYYEKNPQPELYYQAPRYYSHKKAKMRHAKNEKIS